jgi:hypothetical protein
VVSELFANAVQHGPGGGRVLVSYYLSSGGIRIVVCDSGGPTSPRLRTPNTQEEGGRGLHVVDVIAAAWGQFRDHAQVVWCDLGKPLDAALGDDAWAWLPAVIAIAGLSSMRAVAVETGEAVAISRA